jgi:chemotaxis-related protein WspD
LTLDLDRVEPPVAECWARIGVRGDHSCPELTRYIHCRNCPVFSTAATDRLGSDLSDEQISASTRRAAASSETEDVSRRSFLVFRVADEWLAFPATLIREVVGPRTIHSVPHRSDPVVLGVVNIRGQLLACVSLKHIVSRGGSSPARSPKPSDKEQMLVCLHAGVATVYLVDTVAGVARIADPQLTQVSSSAIRHVCAVFWWKERSVSLLNEDLVLSTVNRSLALATAI